MCGIAGFVGAGNRSDLKRMTDSLTHRGPDAEGNWLDQSEAVYFGHRRLSILDHSGGAQPMLSADERLCIVFNGEIYNHAELRKELESRGHCFRSDHSDTEVLLLGYREWGKTLHQKLNGMWAFVIYDRDSKQIFASRDRFGEKPLYYTLNDKLFAWASELSGLVAHPAVSTRLSERALQKYFAYGYIPSPLSIYENIYKLSPGHHLTFDLRSRTCKVEKYWQFELAPQSISARSEESLADAVRETLLDSVRIRMLADVPVGVFLSGGVDSSAISALAVQSAGAHHVRTFNVGFDDPHFDESVYAKQVADHLGTSHTSEILAVSEIKQIAKDIFRRLDEPMADSSIVPTYLLNRFARRQVTVALGGDGGDELFAGYAPFQALSAARKYSSLMPKGLHEAIRWSAGLLPVSHRYMSLDFKVKRFLNGLSHPSRLWFPTWMAPINDTDMQDLLGKPVELEDLYSEVVEVWDEDPKRDIMDQFLLLYTRLYLCEDILAKADRASMMNSLEVRSPFLDIRLVDLVRKIPWQLKFKNGQSKYLLKKAVQKDLPAEIFQRKKQGFAMPVGKWLQEEPFPEGSGRGALNESFVRKSWEEHRTNRKDHRLFLWGYWLYADWQAHAKN